MLALDITYFLGACLVLVAAGSLLVKALSKIASFLRIHEFVLAFILMAFSTSLPELFFGISSALKKVPALSLGNIIGANILDLTLVAGISAVLARGVKIESKTVKKDALYMMFISILPLGLMLIGSQLSKIDGIILIAVFILYSWKLIREGREFKREVSDRIKRWEIVFYVVLFIVSIVALYISASFAVEYAKLVSIKLGMQEILIGLFIVSIGTTLPELIFGTTAVLRKHGEMMLGASMGSVVVNSTLILGIVALIQPITAPMVIFFTSAAYLVLVAFLFATFVESGNEIYWKEGIALILLYVFFLIIEFYAKVFSG